MKKPSQPFIRLLAVYTLLAIIFLTAHLSFLKQAQKLNHLESQTRIIFNTQVELYKNLVKFDGILESAKVINQETIQEILSKVNDMSKKNQTWKEEYNVFLDSLKEDLDSLGKVELE